MRQLVEFPFRVVSLFPLGIDSLGVDRCDQAGLAVENSGGGRRTPSGVRRIPMLPSVPHAIACGP